MSKARGIEKTIKVSGSIFVSASLTGFAYASFIATEGDETNFDATVYIATIQEAQGLEIKAYTYSNLIYLDASSGDNEGRVTYIEDGNTENMDILIKGTASYVDASNWSIIRASILFDGYSSNGTSYQSIYENLIEEGYITAPNFDDLYYGKYGSSKSKWTMDDFTEETWTFEMSASFGYGSYFNYTNPSLFFDSDELNGEKVGSAYSKDEIAAILDKLLELNGAQYQVILTVISPEVIWRFSSFSSTQLNGLASLTDPASILVTFEDGTSQVVKEGDEFEITLGSKFKVSNYHGVDEIVVSGSNDPDSSGFYTARNATRIIAYVAPAISITVKATYSSSNSTYSNGTNLGINVLDNEESGYSFSTDLIKYPSEKATTSVSINISSLDEYQITKVSGTAPSAITPNITTSGNDEDYYISPNQAVTVTVSGCTYFNDTGGGDTCLLPDTPILMGDGSYKRAIDLEVGDLAKVFDHEKGEFAVEPIIINDDTQREEEAREVITLYFDDGKQISIVYEHGFFDIDRNSYVYVHPYDAEQYLGDHFVAYNDEKLKSVQLISINIEIKRTKVCSPVSRRHLNIIAGDLLSMPGGLDGLFNIFEYGGDNLKFSKKDIDESIAKYGLLNKEVAEKELGIDPFIYDLVYGDYVSIALGKGMLTEDMIKEYLDKWGETLMSAAKD